MLEGLDLNYDEFVDLCILCGCDFTSSIEGIGPITAFKLITEHRTIEKVLEWIKLTNEEGTKKRKYNVPVPYNYEEARVLFKDPLVLEKDEINISWNKNPDVKALKEFLVDKK